MPLTDHITVCARRAISVKKIATLYLAFASFSFCDTFTSVDYLFKSEGTDKIELVGGNLSFDELTGKLSFRSSTQNLDIPTASVTSISYGRANKPRYAVGVLRPVPFAQSKQHYLTIQYTEAGTARYAFFRLRNRNYRQVIAAAEATTGKRAKRETQ